MPRGPLLLHRDELHGHREDGARRPRALLIAQLAAFAALALQARTARADLDGDAERLARAWKARGAEVQRLDPVFVDHGRNRYLDIAARGAKGDAECISIVVLGAPSSDFSVSPAPLSAPADAPSTPVPPGHPLLGGLVDRSVHSAVGAAALSRCGSSRSDLLRISLDMSSPRGALEIVVARSAGPLGDLREVMPERAFGPMAPRGNPGRPIEPGPLVDRVNHAEQRARTERAKFARVPMLASPEGAGEFVLRLEGGCHRVDLMAEVPTFLPRRATDLDAEARIGEDGRVLARDRGEAADARLDFCIGEPTRVAIPFGGAAGPVMVVAADTSWPIPSAVPVHWGSRPRAGFAMALRRRHAPEPSSPPVAESLGSGGGTMIPVAVEPGRCYLAGVAIARGEPRGLRITAAVGDRYTRDEVSERGDGAALAFCAESEDVARIEVEARGEAIWWAFALWPLGGTP